MEEIKRLWSEFSDQPFPRGYVGEGDLAELWVDLAEHDSYAAGCIDTFILNRGDLDTERISTLEICIQKLNILKDLFGENNAQNKAYAEQLLVLSEKVLETSKQAAQA